ncbi:hypothetical protein ACSNOB_10725 [Micromonospora sp. URMC 106]|uniref:hypothetical protein n=1 Tax=Micromonospora sp. URMC 106 TaxID=3423408 RepID=UPI003F19C16B
MAAFDLDRYPALDVGHVIELGIEVAARAAPCSVVPALTSVVVDFFADHYREAT